MAMKMNACMFITYMEIKIQYRSIYNTKFMLNLVFIMFRFAAILQEINYVTT